jgi:hypothetical protein
LSVLATAEDNVPPVVLKLTNDLRRDEHQQFGLAVAARILRVLEQPADHRDVAEQRHLVDVWCAPPAEDAADHDRAAVLDQHLRLHVLGVDRRPGGVGWPRLSLLTLTSRKTLPSGVICGVTSSFRSPS